MTFLWPEMLWALLALPVLIAVYLTLLRRKKRAALRYASLIAIRDALGAGQRVRRHVPPALFLVALTLMIVAIARPAAVVMLPSAHQTVILAMDVSGSMRATEDQPHGAAHQLRRSSATCHADRSRILCRDGVRLQPPTNNRRTSLLRSDRFQLQRGTAVGSAILISLKILSRTNSICVRRIRAEAPRSASLTRPRSRARTNQTGAAGSRWRCSHHIAPRRQTQPDPIDRIRALAADRGVKVYTVGIGTTSGELISAEGWSMRVRLDEASLKTIANLTQGEYFYAGTAAT
jgi:Ca-activated chloride channel family protein